MEPEFAARGLVAAVIRRALRDLHSPAWRQEAQWWLAHEGREWGMLIDVDVDVDKLCKNTKGRTHD
jgi:hypothetical protein